jgi:alanine racemase
MAHPGARRNVVRLGIAIYGISPGGPLDQLACDLDLRPALSLKARVSTVRRVAVGDGVSYGLRHRFTADTTVAVLPLGYADGVPRRLGLAGGEVLLHGRRCPIRGVVTMDQIVVEVGDLPVAVGDEAVLIGRQGDESVTASDWAALCDTIGYEIVCGISRRIERKPV